MKILIADDDAVTLRLLERKINQWNFQAVTATDGLEALKVLEADPPPKLAILDWMMPGMDGIDVCRRLREMETTRAVYVILLTSRSGKSDMLEGLAAGADDYVVKPFDSEELLARIKVGKRLIELQTALMEKEKLSGVLEMAGAVCHELNQPMQVASGLTELLLLDIPPDHKLYEKLKTIKKHVDRMGVVTQKLMRITSYETKAHVKGKIIDIDKSIK